MRQLPNSLVSWFSLEKWWATTVLLLGITFLIAVGVGVTQNAPVAAQEIEPTVTTTPAAVSPNAPDDEPRSYGLFYEIDGEPPPGIEVDTFDSRFVGIDWGQLDQAVETPIGPRDPVTGEPQAPQKLVLNLFDDVVFTGIVEHVEPTASGHALWGSLEDVELGTMTLVVNGSTVVGTVRSLGAVYSIRTASDRKYVIRQIDESTLPPLGEPLEGSPSPRDPSTQADDVPADDGSVIDVMVVYTPDAKHHEGGRAAIEALIDLFVAETNQAYANSGVTHRIRLVFRDEVDYTEDGDSSIDLSRLRENSDGYMDDVHELRDLYGADLVHIVLGRGDVCGRASLIRSESSADGEARGFGLTVSGCGGMTFAHELGHNMGLHHDRYELGVSRGYHYGYVNQRMFEAGVPESVRWRTIMSYSTQCTEVGDFYCELLPYFSNPEKTYKGDPMGVPVDNPSTGVDGPADGVKSLNERREITANFRRSLSSPTPRVGLTLSPYWLSERGGSTTVTATLHRPSTADTTVTISASPSDAVTLSANAVLTIPAGETVSRGSVTITGADNGDRTGDVNVTISVTAANSSNLGVVEPEPVVLVIADDETTPTVSLSLSPAEIVEIDGRTFATATLNNRSGADTTITVSAAPAEILEEIRENTLYIPAGQTTSVGRGVRITAVDDSVLMESEKSVTISGTATNSLGVTGPESVTLTVYDDETPFFKDDTIAFTFTEGLAGTRFLPEAAYGNGTLTYSLSPTPSNGITFTPDPPARLKTSSTSVAGGETSYTLTVTDADGDTDTMTIRITVRKGVCKNSAAVSRYTDPGIIDDCEALLSSRDALRGDKSLNWSRDLSIEEWQGIEIVGGRVVGINIVREGLNGTIPSELGSISSLRELNLYGNRLTGGIPAEFDSLSSLEGLGLGENQLTGEIPPELGSLTNLRWLALSASGLTGEIPAELGNLTNLWWLTLDTNGLTGEIPAELGNLSNLQDLSLFNNQFTGSIPTELGNLSNLRSLWLRGNLLTGCVPDSLRDVRQSDFVRLGLPFCSEHACSSGGAVAGGANPELVADCDTLLRARDTLSGTATLNWSADNPMADWSGVVVGGTAGRVIELRLSDLGLTGQIPLELGSLPNLQYLDLSDNQLTGGIPTELGDLENLQFLYLSGNSLAGCVPDGLRDVPKNDLESLGLTFCSEHPCVSGGAVSDLITLGLLADCVTLLETRDTLAGSVTLNWSTDTHITQWDGVTVDETQRRVTRLILNDWGLEGKIPKELGSLSNLHWLNLRQLVGPEVQPM